MINTLLDQINKEIEARKIINVERVCFSQELHEMKAKVKILEEKIQKLKNQELNKEEKNQEFGNEDDEEDNVCVICFAARPNILTLPCEHAATCSDCFCQLNQANGCPRCTQKITKVIKIKW